MNFVTTLKQELDKRCRNNSGYSLRAFSRDLEIDPSKLSKILAGKINPRERTQEKLLLSIGLTPKKIAKIIDNKDISPARKKFEKLQAEQFEVIAEWYHFAILELTRLSFFKPSARWISSQLEVPLVQIEHGIKRLLDLGYLQITDDNVWIDQLGDITTNLEPHQTSEALRLHQIYLMEKSRKTIKKANIEKRSHTSTMVAIDERDLDIVKEKIQNFRQEITEYLERKEIDPNHLYQLQIGFFPLIRKEN